MIAGDEVDFPIGVNFDPTESSIEYYVISNPPVGVTYNFNPNPSSDAPYFLTTFAVTTAADTPLGYYPVSMYDIGAANGQSGDSTPIEYVVCDQDGNCPAAPCGGETTPVPAGPGGGGGGSNSLRGRNARTPDDSGASCAVPALPIFWPTANPSPMSQPASVATPFRVANILAEEGTTAIYNVQYSMLPASCTNFSWNTPQTTIPGATAAISPSNNQTALLYVSVPAGTAPGANYSVTFQGACSSGPSLPANSNTFGVVQIDPIDVTTNSTKVLTNRSFERVAGQFARLDVNVQPAGAGLTNVRWTIPGQQNNELVSSYTRGEQGTVVYAADPTLHPMEFFPDKGEPSQSATLLAAVAGIAPSTKQFAYDVDAPTSVQMPATTNGVNLAVPLYPIQPSPPPGSIICLMEMGMPYSSTVAGIDFQYFGATMPATGGGTLMLTQLIKRDSKYTSGLGTTSAGTGGAVWLDTAPNYLGGAAHLASGQSGTFHSIIGGPVPGRNFSDTPGLGLNPGYEFVTNVDSFETFLTFAPDPGPFGKVIPITLGLLDWGWSGTSENIDPSSTMSAWTLTASSVIPGLRARIEMPPGPRIKMPPPDFGQFRIARLDDLRVIRPAEVAL